MRFALRACEGAVMIESRRLMKLISFVNYKVQLNVRDAQRACDGAVMVELR